MGEDLLRDLAMYKNYKDKSVVMAARTLIGHYREQLPNLLHKKDRGRPTEASVEIKPKKYGEVIAVDHIAGAEALLKESTKAYIKDKKGEDSDDSEDWVDVDHGADTNDIDGWETASDDGEAGSGDDGQDGWKTDSEEEEKSDASEESDEENEESGSEEEESEEDEDEENQGQEAETSKSSKNPESSRKTRKSESSTTSKLSKSSKPSEKIQEKEVSRELVKELALTKIFTDEDFSRIEGEMLRKKVTNSRKRKAEEPPEKSEFVKLNDIEMIYKKRRTDKQARMESMHKGREGREKYGYKDGRHSIHCSKTNREKEKNKNFLMMRHKARGKVKKSFRDKQLALRKHLTQQKKMK